MNPNYPRCAAYDQISDRSCRYDANHKGRHNFARLDHDTTLARDLRRRLDEMTAARDVACDLALRVLTGKERLDGGGLARLKEQFQELRQLDSDVPTHASELDA